MSFKRNPEYDVDYPETAKERRRRVMKKFRREYRASEEGKKKRKSQKLKYKYGLSEEEYLNMYVAQGNKCAICEREVTPFTKLSYVDHCHRTGKVRGILCRSCNWGLGNFKDSEESLMKASVYLKNARSDNR